MTRARATHRPGRRTSARRELAPLGGGVQGAVLAHDPYGRPSVVQGPPDHPMLAAVIAAQAWPRARQALRVRLQRADSPLVGPFSRPLGGDLVISLGVAVTGGCGNVQPESLDAWPVDEQEAFEKGLVNLASDTKRLRVGTLVVEAPPGRWDGLEVHLRCLEGSAAAHCGRALLLDQLLGDEAPFGRLVSAPHREVVWAHTITDDSAEAAAELLGLLTDADHRDGDHPLSSEVYWAPPGRPLLDPGWVPVHDAAFTALLGSLPARGLP